jgi:hypothetical protein
MTSAQEKSLAISRDVVGLDVEKYAASVSGSPSDSYLGVVPQENVRYTFQLNASKVDVRYTFANGKLRMIHVLEGSRSPLLTKTAINTLESAKDFLGSYQDYSANSFYGELKSMLSNVDVGKNATETSGNIKLEVTVSEDLESEDYKWTYVYDGVEASAKCVALGYKNGFLKYFLDNWELYKIGSTSVNISEKAAIDIAMQRASTFSWNMGTDDNMAKIMNFTVTNAMVWETVFFSNLYADQPRSQDPLTLYPIRHVWVSLDKFYPGNVYGINVYVWADTGEICYIHERVSTLDPLPELVAEDSDFTVEVVNNQVSGGASQFSLALPVFAVITLGTVPVWFLLGRKKNLLSRRLFKVGGVLLCLLSLMMLLIPVASVSASSPKGRAEIWGAESTGGYDERIEGSWKYWRKTYDEVQQQRSVSSVIDGYFDNHGYDSANNQGSQGDGSLKEVILDDISYNDANYPRVAVVDFDHGVGTTSYVSGEYHYMFEDNVGTIIGAYPGVGYHDEHAVTDMDVYERTAEGDVFFAFINTCLSACITNIVGSYETRQGIIAGNGGTYRARGMPFAWTHRSTDVDLSTNGYGYPDDGSQCYLGFPYGSAALDQTLNGSSPIYAEWFRDFFWYALTSDISVNDALDDASIQHFQKGFSTTDLASNFPAYWPIWRWYENPYPHGEWSDTTFSNSRLAVYGNGRIHLYQKGGVWDLNENQGSTAHDSTYSNNDGTISGASWATGKFGSALNFDGSNDYVNVPHSDSISGLSSVTLTMWVKLDALPPSNSVNLGGIIGEYWLEYRNTGYISLSTYINGNYDGQGFYVNLADGHWHLLTMTYDDTYKKGYLDGELQATYQISGTLSDTNNAFTIGASFPASQGYNGCPDGSIDEVRVYNRALLADEIADYYDAFPRYYYVTVVATDQYSQTLYAPLYIDYQLVGTTGDTYTVTEGSHVIHAATSFASGGTTHDFEYYYYDGEYTSEEWPTISITQDKTVTVYYYSY